MRRRHLHPHHGEDEDGEEEEEEEVLEGGHRREQRAEDDTERAPLARELEDAEQAEEAQLLDPKPAHTQQLVADQLDDPRHHDEAVEAIERVGPVTVEATHLRSTAHDSRA